MEARGMEWVTPGDEELAERRRDPLLVEQELDVRPAVAEALERACGLRAGTRFWRSRHGHLLSLTLADLGRGRPSRAEVAGWWDRWEPRPPEVEIDRDLLDLCLWVAEVAPGIEPEDVRRVAGHARMPRPLRAGEILRTPDERFERLPGFPWVPRTVEVEALRITYVEEGTGDPVLLLHGEPTWSFIWRHAIPPLARSHRVVAPDLVGFGRSDKPRGPEWYTFAAHVRWVRQFIEALDLRRITLVAQDWGGLIGLRVVAGVPERFDRLVLTNTGLPDGRQPVPEAFLRWRRFSQRLAAIDCGRLVDRALLTKRLTEAERAAYDAPFPSADFQTGALVFPRLVPVRPDMPGARASQEARAVLSRLDLPVLLAFSDGDPITAPWAADLQALFRRAAPPVTMRGPGHFVQEEQGPELAALTLDFIAGTRGRA
jgi:haloalkane dehalogenase